MIKTGVRNWGDRLSLDVPPSTGVREGLQWLMFARLSVFYIALTFIVFPQVLRTHFLVGHELIVGFGLLTLGFLFNFLMSLALDRVSPHWGWVWLNILFDTTLTSAWIVISGNRESLFALLYLIEILVVALTFYRKGALAAAGVSIVSFGFCAYYVPYELISWLTYSAIFAVLGFVGGYLSEELLRTNQRLKEKSDRIVKLTELQDQILNSMPTGVLSVDGQMRINFLNPAGEHILNLLSREVVGVDLKAACPGLLPFFTQIESEEIAEEGATADDTTLSATGSAFHRAFFVKSKTEMFRLQQVVEIGKGAQRRVLRGDVAGGKVLLFQDVTRVWNLEEKLKQNEKLAAVGQLAAGIAHEIRNPLASMSASIEMLKGSIPGDLQSSENHRLMDIAIREIDRLNDLITDFLDFVKPENFKMGEVDLKQLVSEVLLTIRNTKEFKDKIDIRERLEAGVVASANAEKLKQVLWNLLMNAIQSMSAAGQIEVGCTKSSESSVKFWVEDSGVGMTAEVLAHLYEPFFTTKPKGTGLGLATAYRIIEAHHGEIRVQSTPNVGTRFEVVLNAA